MKLQGRPYSIVLKKVAFLLTTLQKRFKTVGFETVMKHWQVVARHQRAGSMPVYEARATLFALRHQKLCFFFRHTQIHQLYQWVNHHFHCFNTQWFPHRPHLAMAGTSSKTLWLASHSCDSCAWRGSSSKAMHPSNQASQALSSVFDNNVLLGKIEGPVWYTIYHLLPVVEGVVSNPSINQPTNGKRTSMLFETWTEVFKHTWDVNISSRHQRKHNSRCSKNISKKHMVTLALATLRSKTYRFPESRIGIMR